MSRVWGWTAFAKAQRSNESPSGAFKRQRGLAQARWRGVAPTSATPTRSLRKCRRIEEVKSGMDRKFSRIENLWPQDGSCPLPLRSKPFLGNCFRIVKARKISRGGAAHVMGIAVCSERSSCLCLCSGVVRLAHGKCEVMARYHVQTAYEGFKVQYEESRTQCGHYNLLLSNTRITL